MSEKTRLTVQSVEWDVSTRESLRCAYDREVTSGKGDADVFQWEHNGIIHDIVMAYAKYQLVHLDSTLPKARVWMSPPPAVCDIDGESIEDKFYDSRMVTGTMWANMCPHCWQKYGPGILGTGHGQRYQRRADGVFVKTGG